MYLYKCELPEFLRLKQNFLMFFNLYVDHEPIDYYSAEGFSTLPFLQLRPLPPRQL